MCQILELVWNPASYFIKHNDSFEGKTQCNDTQIDERPNSLLLTDPNKGRLPRKVKYEVVSGDMVTANWSYMGAVYIWHSGLD